MNRLRYLLAGLGVLGGLYGAYLLLSREGTNAGLINVAEWLVVGVVLHDFVLVPITLAVLLVGRRLLPAAALRPVTVGLIVLGATTIFAIPVLGRFGARPDNPTLLDRNYTVGWLVVAGLVLLGVVVAILVGHRRGRTPAHGVVNQ